MALDSAPDHGQGGFGDPGLFNKIDELRRLNIAAMVPLPQLVVVGDQSAGKSSVLEGLTGFPFPRAVNLCTRYATEIICRRDEVKNTTITIRPQPGASADRVTKLQEFKVDATDFDPTSASFQDVFQKAAVAMGLRMGSEKDDTAPAFSEDVLRIEITGPKEDHLTIIDVPGIFEAPEPGVTTKNDIALVKSMVHNYIREPRTIILAVAACPSDIATQQIFERAEEVDPEGKRTIGVLTKPDLLTEQATTNTVLELVKGHRKPLKLGYFVVRNRGADDLSSSLSQRHAAESGFFNNYPWSQLDKGRLGIPALRLRLRELLMDRTRHEFPNVARDIMAHLKQSREILKTLGAARTTSDQQRTYLGYVASEFRKLGQFALDAYYTASPMFDEYPEARLVTHIRELSDAFAKTLFSKGHRHSFQMKGAFGEQSSGDAPSESKNAAHGTDSLPEHVSRNDIYDVSFDIADDAEFPELVDLLAEPAICQDPLSEDISNYIHTIYLAARGQELGTFGKAMLPTVFKEQSKKWKDLTLAHVSNVILVVHRFIHVALRKACPDDQVRDRLRSFIRDDLIDCYRRSMDHAEFLLRIECEGKAITCNPEFDKILRQNKQLRHQKKADKVVESKGLVDAYSKNIDANKLAAILADTSEVDQICEDLHDVLKAYYEVARSRFVDAVYQQVVDHFMLSDERSALRVFGPERVLSMTSDQLKTIAEEEASSKRTRETLEHEIACLKEGMRVLSS